MASSIFEDYESPDSDEYVFSLPPRVATPGGSAALSPVPLTPRRTVSGLTPVPVGRSRRGGGGNPANDSNPRSDSRDIKVYDVKRVPPSDSRYLSGRGVDHSTHTYYRWERSIAPSLEPSDNFIGPILADLSDDELPDIGAYYPPGYMVNNTRLDQPEHINVNDIVKSDLFTFPTIPGYEGARYQGDDVPFYNPHPLPRKTPPNRVEVLDLDYRGPVVLMPHQIDVARRLAYGYHYHPGFLNTGRLGSGKTHLGLWIAQYLQAAIFVVCPKTLINVWIQAATQAGIPIINVITYQSLAAEEGRQPTHGLLYRQDIHHSYQSVRGKDRTERLISYDPTPYLIDLITAGVVFIFDEIQNTKNESAQSYATAGITRTIHRLGRRGRYFLASGSPLDKVEHIYSLYNIMNLIGYCYLRYNGRRDGISEEIITKASAIDSEAVTRVLGDRTSFDDRMTLDDYFLFNIFVAVYKPRFITGMNLEQSNPVPVDIRNGFYSISPSFRPAWQLAIDSLSAGIITNEFGENKVNLTKINEAMIEIENNIYYDMALRGWFHLLSDPTCKVILYFSHIDPVNWAANLLLEFNPVILIGENSSEEDRSRDVAAFNDPHSNVRVLVSNIAVGGVGISLHDTAVRPADRRPRIMYISPTYNIQHVFQATGRIVRHGMTSPVTIRIFYGHPANLDLANDSFGNVFRIFDILARKSETTWKILDDTSISQLRMPSNYDIVVEGVIASDGTISNRGITHSRPADNLIP